MLKQITKFQILVFVLLTQACGKNIGLLKNNAESNSLRQSINQEAQNSLTVGDLSLFKGYTDSRSRYFKNPSSYEATANLTYLGVKEVPQVKLAESEKGNRFFVPAIEVSSVYIDYTGRDTYEFPETTLYLTGVSDQQVYFHNLERNSLRNEVGTGMLSLAVTRKGKVTFYENTGTSIVMTQGKIYGKFYNEVMSLLPADPVQKK